MKKRIGYKVIGAQKKLKDAKINVLNGQNINLIVNFERPTFWDITSNKLS